MRFQSVLAAEMRALAAKHPRAQELREMAEVLDASTWAYFMGEATVPPEVFKAKFDAAMKLYNECRARAAVEGEGE